jgi:hypothetical protein
MNILPGYETTNIFWLSCFPFLLSAFLINPFLFLFLPHGIFQLRQGYSTLRGIPGNRLCKKLHKINIFTLLRETLPLLSISVLNISVYNRLLCITLYCTYSRLDKLCDNHLFHYRAVLLYPELRTTDVQPNTTRKLLPSIECIVKY